MRNGAEQEEGRDVGRSWRESPPSCSVRSDSLRPQGLKPARLLCPWASPGKSTGVGCHALLQGSSQPRVQTCLSCFGRQFLHH